MKNGSDYKLREIFEEAGGVVYDFIPCLNDSDPWIDALETWVKDWCVNKLPTQHIA